MLRVVLLGFALALLAGEARAQQPFGRADTTARPDPEEEAAAPALTGAIDERVKAEDSVAYRLVPASRLTVKTGKAGLFGFAGHTHVIRARAFHGQVVYYPKAPASSHLEITIVTDSLEVLTPPDTAEIRKVTAAMRTDVLHTAQHPRIRFVSRQVTPNKEGFHVVGALTLVGQTREVPVAVAVQIGVDTLLATAAFAVKQTDFGIKPYSGGPAGTVKVADKVTFDIRAIGVRAGR